MAASLLSVNVFVLHVREGYEERGVHMDNMLGRMGIAFDYILDGDKSDLDHATLNRYFRGDMCEISNATSCALKHLLAYKRIIECGLDGALILEDDISLRPDFAAFVESSLEECRRRGIKECLISFEDTSMQFVPGSQRRKWMKIYKAQRDRFAGCYYISAGCARQILDYVASYKCHLPIDLFHTHLIEAIDFPYYWSHPTVATQGSKDGRFGSSISARDHNRRKYLRISHPLKLLYKRLLYRLK